MDLEFFTQLSFIFNVVLCLLLIFQWYKQYAKEQSVKNNLIAVKGAIERIQNLANTELATYKSKDLVDILDATLATLGARHPFDEKREMVLNVIRKRFTSESKKPLEVEGLPTEQID